MIKNFPNGRNVSFKSTINSAKEKGKGNIIEAIESVDPIGFCAFLNKKHE